MEDELLWSAVARFNRNHLDVHSDEQLGMLLLGDRQKRVDRDFPSWLEDLAANTKYCWGDASEIVLQRTLFPFVAPFVSVDRGEQMWRTLVGMVPPKKLAGSWRNAVRAPAKGEDRYCPECRRQDFERCGYAWWRRIHRIGAVSSCPWHPDVALESVRVAKPRKYYAALDDEPVLAPRRVRADRVQQALLNGIREWYEIMPLPWIGNTSIADAVIVALQSRDQKAASQADMRSQIRTHYGSAALSAARMGLDGGRFDWVGDLFGSDSRLIGVPHFSLLAGWLGMTARDLVREIELVELEDGPWPCMDPQSTCDGDLTIRKWTLSKDRRRAVFECPDCGCTYSRPLPLQSLDGRLFDLEYVRISYASRDELKRALVDLRQSPFDVARRWGVPETLIASVARDDGYKATLGEEIKLPIGRRAEDLTRKRAEHRGRWLELKQTPDNEKFPGERRRVERWLRKHDCEWFSYRSPAGSPKRQEPARKTDYSSLDASGVEVVSSLGGRKALHAANPRRRITVEVVLKSLPAHSGITRFLLPKLPKTKAAIEALVESEPESVKRRLTQCLSTSGKSARSAINLANLAGLGYRFVKDPKVKLLIQRTWKELRCPA